MAFHFDPKTHCQNMRCKEMYAHEPRDREREAEMARLYGGGSSPAFWCLKTQTARGPDGGRVNDTGCSAGRSCFVGLEELA
jgi:hypothetical protein